MPLDPESTLLPPGLPSENQPPGRKNTWQKLGTAQYSPELGSAGPRHSSHGVPEEPMTGGQACPYTLGLEQALLNPVPSGFADL